MGKWFQDKSFSTEKREQGIKARKGHRDKNAQKAHRALGILLAALVFRTVPFECIAVSASESSGDGQEECVCEELCTDTYVCSVPATVIVAVTPIPLIEDMVTLSAANVTYNGAEQRPTAAVDGLTAGTDYEVIFQEGFKNAGEYTVTVTGRGIYEGTVEKTFTIEKATPTVAWKENEEVLTYTGQPADIEPTVTLVNNETFSGTITYTYGVYSGPDRPTDAASYTVRASIPE